MPDGVSRSGFKKFSVGVDLSDSSTIANVQVYMRKLEQVAKNLSDSGEAFVSATKHYQDKIIKDIYVKTSAYENAVKGFESVKKSSVHESNPMSPESSHQIDPVIVGGAEDVKMVTLKKQMLGNYRAIAAYRRYVAQFGGKMEALPEDNMYQVTVPDIKIGNYASGTTKTVRSTLATMVSTDNDAVKRKEHQERTTREEDKSSREAVMRETKVQREEERKAKKEESLDALKARKDKEERKRMMGDIMGGWKPAEDDEKGTRLYWQRLEESSRLGSKAERAFAKNVLAGGDGDDGEGGKGKDPFKTIKSLTYYTTIIALLKLLIDITKAFFDGIRNAASAANTTMNNSAITGISAIDLVGYTRGENFKGVKSGTTASGILSLKNAFGDPTNMNEKLLKYVGITMGAGVENYVRMGLGGGGAANDLYESLIQNALGMIKNKKTPLGFSTGSQVESLATWTAFARNNGVDESIISMVSARAADAMGTNLSKEGKDVAWNGTTKEWMQFQSANYSNPMSLSNVDYIQAAKLEPLIASIEGLIAAFKDGFWVKLAPALESFIVGMRRVLIGFASSSEKQVYRNDAHAVGMSGVSAGTSVIENMQATFGAEMTDAVMLGKGFFKEGSKRSGKDPNIMKAIRAYVASGELSDLDYNGLTKEMSSEGLKRVLGARARFLAIEEGKKDIEEYRKNSKGENAILLAQYNAEQKRGEYLSSGASKVLSEIDGKSSFGSNLRTFLLALSNPALAVATHVYNVASSSRERRIGDNVYGIGGSEIDRGAALEAATVRDVSIEVAKETAVAMARSLITREGITNVGKATFGVDADNKTITVRLVSTDKDGRDTVFSVTDTFSSSSDMGGTIASYMWNLSSPSSSVNMSKGK